MEIDRNRKNTFSAISINRITAERFRAYSKKVSKSHSETIDSMIDFFEKANITPKNKIIINFIKFQIYLNGRFDYIEQLLRDMESKYLKPTHDMLKSLFDGPVLQKKQPPLLMNRPTFLLTKEEWNLKEGKVSAEKYQSLLKARSDDRETFFKLLNSITEVDPIFSKPYFKVEMDAAELERIKQKLNKR